MRIHLQLSTTTTTNSYKLGWSLVLSKLDIFNPYPFVPRDPHHLIITKMRFPAAEIHEKEKQLITLRNHNMISLMIYYSLQSITMCVLLTEGLPPH